MLPEPIKTPTGLVLPFSWVRVRGDRAYVSGHVPLNPDGSVAKPFGKVGAEVSEEQGYEAARLAALAVLGSLKRGLGDLDRGGMAKGLRDGQLRSRLRRPAQRDKRLLGPHPRVIRSRDVGPRPLGGGHGGAATRGTGRS